jgi:hypothetical protein
MRQVARVTRSLRIGVPTAALLALAVSARAATSVAIGVISPETGRSGSTGVAQRQSIEWALQDIGYSVLSGARHVTLRAILEDDHGDPVESVRLARKLAEQDHVVAILGPANSACTEAVLKANLGVPIISPLSSAPSLTDTRDRWFFRATIDDRERMNRFIRFLEDPPRRLGDTSIFLYEDDAYGRGLAASLGEALGGESIEKPWTDVLADPKTLVATLPGGTVSIFVLGTEAQALDLAGTLDDLLADARPEGGVNFLFVGDGERLRQDAPPDSITIGEPAPDVEREAILDVPGMVRPFLTDERRFLLTAYETARYILPKALQYALASGVDPGDVSAVREKLREELDSKPFDSLDPSRKIRFVGGNLDNPPPTPIYQVHRTLARLDTPPAASWLSVGVPEHTRFLEEPVPIAIERRGASSGDTVSLQILDDDDQVIQLVSVPLTDGKGSYTFHPRRPGHFRVWSSAAMVPNEPAVDVGYPLDYLLALAGALLGVVLVTRRATIPPGRALQGIVVGAVLFALSSYGRAIPWLANFPLPSLSPSRATNALLSGMIGGWGGLDVLLGMVTRLPWWPQGVLPIDHAEPPHSDAPLPAPPN